MPIGKPHTKTPYAGFPDSRTREDAPGQKGTSCVYYAFNNMRIRYGMLDPEASLQEKEARRVEKVFSTWRKESTAISWNNIDFKDSKQNERYWSTREKVNQKALEVFGLDIICMYIGATGGSSFWNREPRSRPIFIEEGTKSWQGMSVEERCAQLHHFVIQTMVNKYGLVRSSWSPGGAIENLMGVLRRCGPLVVGAYLGRGYYLAEPKQSSRTIGGSSYFFFPKGSPRKVDEGKKRIGHVVILVGAEKRLEDDQEQALVYYIDPLDKNRVSSGGYPLYVTSYKTFQLYTTYKNEEVLLSRTATLVGELLEEVPACYGIHAHPELQKAWGLPLSLG